jgi:hypothetical protein
MPIGDAQNLFYPHAPRNCFGALHRARLRNLTLLGEARFYSGLGGLDLGVQPFDEAFAGLARLGDLRVDVRREFGGENLVECFVLRDQRGHFIARGDNQVALRDKRVAIGDGAVPRNDFGVWAGAVDSSAKTFERARKELCGIFGDGVNQAADFFSDATSIPSRNVTPLTTFGN